VEEMQNPPNDPRNPQYGQQPPNWGGNIPQRPPGYGESAPPPPQGYGQVGVPPPGYIPPPPGYSSVPPKKRGMGFWLLIIGLPLVAIAACILFVTAIVGIVAVASDAPRKEFESFLNFTKQRDSAAAYAILSPQLQSEYSLASFDTGFVARIAPELSNYSGLNYNSLSIRNSTAQLSGTLQGSGQEFVVQMTEIGGKWKITGFSVGRFRAGSVF
jgi:hypothetical protein